MMVGVHFASLRLQLRESCLGLVLTLAIKATVLEAFMSMSGVLQIVCGRPRPGYGKQLEAKTSKNEHHGAGLATDYRLSCILA